MAQTERLDQAVADLHEWFGDVMNATTRSVFQVAPEGPHRDAVVLDVLSRNARTVAEEPLDHDGILYTPLCLFLAASCRKLGVTVGPGHWRAALKNYLELEEKILLARQDTSQLGLEIGSVADLFKDELAQSIQNAGLGREPTFLDRHNREIALGLAVNWGLRFLPAYAEQCTVHEVGPGQRDLNWIAKRVRSLLTVLPVR